MAASMGRLLLLQLQQNCKNDPRSSKRLRQANEGSCERGLLDNRAEEISVGLPEKAHICWANIQLCFATCKDSKY